MKVILYTTHCPKCRVLETALKAKNLSYDICDDVDAMVRLGLASAPALDIDGKLYDYSAAMDYVMGGGNDTCETCSL